MTQFQTSTAFSDAAVVSTPKQCRRCGYDLRGLTYGNPCPECGEIIAKVERVAEGMLGQAPNGYLNGLRVGAYLMAAGGMGLLFINLDLFLADWPRQFAVSGLILWVFWIAGVAIIFRPRPRLPDTTIGGPKEWPILRYSSIATQCAVPCWAILAIVAESTGAPAVEVASELFGAVACVGLVPVTLLLAEYAHWASDDPAARRLEGTAWVLGVSYGAVIIQNILSALGMSLSLLTGAFIFFIVLLWCFTLAFLCLQCAGIGNMITWAKRNARNAAAREQRRLERDRRAAQSAAVDAASVRPPIDVDEQLYEQVMRDSEKNDDSQPAPRPGDRSQPIIKRTDADPYNLED